MQLSDYGATSVRGSGNVPGPEPVSPRPKRRRPLFRLYWGIPLLLMAVAAGHLQYQKLRADRQVADGSGAGIATSAVALGDIHSTVRISGTVVAERSAMIVAPRIRGSRADANRGGGGAHDHGAGGHPDFTLTLLRLVSAGTRLKAGDVVVQFDPESQVQRLDDYQDSVVQTKNSIRKLVANLTANKEAHQQSVRVARANWQKALLDLKTAPIRSTVDAEKLRLTAEETELQYQQLIAEQALVEESQRASIRVSELVLDQSAIEMERAQSNVKRMTMTSPIAGMVVIGSVALNGELRQIREGDQVSPGQPILYVVDSGSMVLEGNVNQVDAERLRMGMRATIRLDAYPGWKSTGTVIGVGAMAKASAFRRSYFGEIPVRLRIEGLDPVLLPDLTGSADVMLNAESNVLLVPRPAVFIDNTKSFVFVRDGDSWTRREIAIGSRSATHVAVRGGLQPGETVATEWPL
jgi:HlyD family secretion protein